MIRRPGPAPGPPGGQAWAYWGGPGRAGTALLDQDNKHVASDLAKAASGAALSPIPLARGDGDDPLIVADGYHRVWASYYWIDENTDIPWILI